MADDELENKPDPRSLSDEDLKALLNTETARISWLDLQPYFARGQVVQVKPGLDLLTVAVELIRDNKETFKDWVDAAQVEGVSNDQARSWYQSRAELWALVIAPWVLVQEG